MCSRRGMVRARPCSRSHARDEIGAHLRSFGLEAARGLRCVHWKMVQLGGELGGSTRGSQLVRQIRTYLLRPVLLCCNPNRPSVALFRACLWRPPWVAAGPPAAMDGGFGFRAAHTIPVGPRLNLALGGRVSLSRHQFRRSSVQPVWCVTRGLDLPCIQVGGCATDRLCLFLDGRRTQGEKGEYKTRRTGDNVGAFIGPS